MRLAPRLSVRALVGVSVGALALGGGLLGGLAIEPIAPLMWGGGFDAEAPQPHGLNPLFALTVASLATSLLLAVALVAGLRRPENVRARTVGACVTCGWLNAPVVLALVWLPRGLEASLGGLGIGLICAGAVVGAPLGLFYGVAAMFATARLRSVLDRPTLASHTTAQQTVGVTVIVGAVIGMIVVVTGAAPLWWWTAPLLLVVGSGLALEAWWRARRIRAVSRSDAYQRVPAAELGIDPNTLLPLDPAVPLDANVVLVRVVPAPRGAYRGAEVRVPIALVE